MKILILSVLFFGICSHDIQVTYYKIHQEDSNLVIDFVFENQDIINVLETNLSDAVLQVYVNSNFSISLNGNLENLVFEDMNIRGDHIHLTGNIPIMNQKISDIEITNTCLLDIEDQSNIIEVRLHETQRDFLMNNERTTIQINY